MLSVLGILNSSKQVFGETRHHFARECNFDLTREAAPESFTFIMGHYLCPRCGSTDSFVGNVLLERRGVTFTREIGDSGVYGSASSGGGSQVIKAVKCRTCSEILSDTNYVPSEVERLGKQVKSRKQKDADYRVAIICGLIGLAVISFLVRVIVDM